MRSRMQGPGIIVWAVAVIVVAILAIAAIAVPPRPIARPTRDEATVWITALTGCGTIAAVAVAAWAAWQSQRAADGTHRTADLMNSQWVEERRERKREGFQRRLSALRAVRTEVATTAAICRGKGILVHPFGSWAYCREEVARAFPQAAAYIDHMNHELQTIERRVDALSNSSLQPYPQAIGMSRPMGGIDAILDLIQKITPELDGAVQMIDSHIAATEREIEQYESDGEVGVK